MTTPQEAAATTTEPTYEEKRAAYMGTDPDRWAREFSLHHPVESMSVLDTIAALTEWFAMALAVPVEQVAANEPLKVGELVEVVNVEHYEGTHRGHVAFIEQGARFPYHVPFRGEHTGGADDVCAVFAADELRRVVEPPEPLTDEPTNPEPCPPLNTKIIWNQREWINDDEYEPELFAHYERVRFSKQPLISLLPWSHMSGAIVPAPVGEDDGPPETLDELLAHPNAVERLVKAALNDDDPAPVGLEPETAATDYDPFLEGLGAGVERGWADAIEASEHVVREAGHVALADYIGAMETMGDAYALSVSLPVVPEPSENGETYKSSDPNYRKPGKPINSLVSGNEATRIAADERLLGLIEASWLTLTTDQWNEVKRLMIAAAVPLSGDTPAKDGQ